MLRITVATRYLFKSMEGAWNPYWGYIGILLGLLGYRSNQPRSSNANMGTTTVATNLAI